MRVVLVLMLALATAACGGSGAVSEADQLACPGQTLTAEERARLVRHIQSRAPSGERDVAPLRRVGRICAARFDWSDRRAALAGLYAISDISQSYMRQRLAVRGFDVGQVERAILANAALPSLVERGREDQAPALIPPLRSATEALTRRPGFTVEDQSELGSFIATRATMELARREFAVPER